MMTIRRTCGLSRTFVGVLLVGLAGWAAPPASTAQEQWRGNAAGLASSPLLTLDEAVWLAIESNPQILIARNEALVATNNHRLGNAGFLPSLSLTAQQSRRAGMGGVDGGGGGVGTLDMGTTLGFTVFDGFRRNATYRRLGVLEERAELGADRVTENMLASIAVLYYDIVRQQQQQEVLLESIAISEERLSIAEGRRDVGAASELEVRRAQVDRNADRAALLRQEVGIASSKAALNELLDRDGVPAFRVSDSIPIDRSLTLEGLKEAALRGNRELLEASRGGDIAALERREIRSESFPTVGLQLGYSMADLSDQLGFVSNQPNGLAYGLTFSLNLFDGLNRERRLQNARLRQQSSVLAVRQARTRAIAGLETAHAGYTNRILLAELEAENEQLARQNVEVALERFRLGLSTSVELREVQNALAAASSRLVTARFEAKQAELELLRLSGELLDRYRAP
jgi:outer membrane protein